MPAHAGEVPEWPPGATADRDVVTLRTLVVPDPEATARLRAAAAATVSPVFRHEGWHRDDVLAEFAAAFVEAREVFRRDLAAAFGPLPLAPEAWETEAVREFHRLWVERTPLLAPHPALARAWARLEDGDREIARLQASLVAMQEHALLHEGDASQAGSGARLVRVGRGERVTEAMLAGRGGPMDPRASLPVEAARRRIAESFEAGERAPLRFVLPLLRANLRFEEGLTRELRERAVAGLESPTRTFGAGEVVVRAGAPVTALAREALDRLRASLPEPPPLERSPAKTTAPDLDGVFKIGLPAAILVLAVAVGAVALRLPRPGSTALAPAAAESPIVAAMRDEAVQRLYGQKRELVEDQDRSLERVASIEERVARLQPGLEARVRAYEERIAELEAHLASAGIESARGPRRERPAALRRS